MRFLHTSDWHLGRSFLGVPLLEDQALVLDQLVRLAVEARVDAVLIAGDVYDRSSPPADAVRLLDDTLTRLVVAENIPVVLIAGNHDSGERLAFGSRLLGSGGLHVAGLSPSVVRLDDEHGKVEIVAIPFAEPAAVAARRGDAAIADHDAAMRADVVASLPGGGAPSSPVPGALRRIAVAHAFVRGGAASESERPLVMGTAALVGADCFDGFCYAALGHLHRPQKVGRDEVRYSGSLLKYSFDEASHRKSVAVVELGANGACRIEEVALAPRRDVRILEGSLDELLRGPRGNLSREDYVLARLSDRGAVLDPIGKLRAVYPNCLRVQRDDFLVERQAGDRERADLRRHDESELFDAFFREVTGQAPSEDEAAAFAAALAAVGRAGQGEA